jgi:RimJ/RimL family protein N-acetyltransferase
MIITGQGHGTEVLAWATSYCFETLGLHKIELDVDADNHRAIHVYEKMGFIREGLRRQRLWVNGHYEDMIEMGILKEEWSQKSRAD